MARTKRKPSTLSTITRAVAARKRKSKKKKNPAPKKNATLVGNPAFWQDSYELILPGVVAYGGTRIAGRIAYRLARKKSPKLAKHVGPWTSVAVAGLAWYAVHKWETFAKYYTPVVVGATIAAIQGLVQTYLPQWGWVLNDYHMDDVLPSAPRAPEQVPGEQREEQELQEPAGGTADEMELDGLLDEGESVENLYTGNFSGGLNN